MNAQELLIKIRPDEIDVSVMRDGFEMHRAVLSRQKGGEALAALLQNHVSESVCAHLQVAGAGDMRLALELARMLAFAGHTVSMGDICRFSPVEPSLPTPNET